MLLSDDEESGEESRPLADDAARTSASFAAAIFELEEGWSESEDSRQHKRRRI